MKWLFFVAIWQFGNAVIGNGFQGNQLLGPIGVNGNAYPPGFPINGGGLPGLGVGGGIGGGAMRPVVRPIKVELECVTSNVGRGVIRWVRQTGSIGSEFDVVAEGPTVFDMSRFNVIYTPLLDSWRSKLIINMVDPSLQQGVYLCQSPNPLPPYTIQSSDPFVVGNNQMSQVGFTGGMGGVGGFGLQPGFGGAGMWRSAGEGDSEDTHAEEKRAELTDVELQHDDKEKRDSICEEPELVFDGDNDDEKKKKRSSCSDHSSPYINDDGTMDPIMDKKSVEVKPIQEEKRQFFLCDEPELVFDGDEEKKKKRSSCSDPSSPFINDDGTLDPILDKKKREPERKKKDFLLDQTSQYVKLHAKARPGKTQVYQEMTANHLQEVVKDREGSEQEVKQDEEVKSRKRRSSKPTVNEEGLGLLHDLYGALDEEGEDYPIYRNNELDTSKREVSEGPKGQPEYPIAGIARGTSHVMMKRG